MIIDRITEGLADGSSRIAVFIRHGEKDSSGSRPALITQQATKDSEALGIRLRELNVSVKVYSSPELRCVQTANILNKEISGAASTIVLTSFLGKPGIQVKDNDRYLKLFEEYSARELYVQWKEGKNHDALRAVEDLCSELHSFLERTTTESKISLFVSQSGTIAALSYALGLSDFDISKNEWVSFLDGFLLVFK
ncbi:histidine phosphatase family protein [Pseudomonas sp. 148P]|uniref:Histidine phosphatase family protein n=1 Tax=Pseudomonas ulcerans TaxID=3115852 RepID=A0ABU7HJH4_9PSED|nr:MULTISPECIES: histidine phosphatase family protein [unclassified Pseudomonas]MEE1921387.1 histidine phosphatase family protein [Pseudomonas sp. 147P]MEE1931670.1 histidine phosphatase family protein [Pseudomonas sp. 148P]